MSALGDHCDSLQAKAMQAQFILSAAQAMMGDKDMRQLLFTLVDAADDICVQLNKALDSNVRPNQ